MHSYFQMINTKAIIGDFTLLSKAEYRMEIIKQKHKHIRYSHRNNKSNHHTKVRPFINESNRNCTQNR